MANYNFTMKEFNGTSYDTLYPKTTSQQVLLNDSALATKLGLSSGATLHDLLDTNNLVGQIVSYAGNGLYGSTNPCSITFSMPVNVIIAVGFQWVNVGDSNTQYENHNVVMVNESTTYQQSHGFVKNLSTYGGSDIKYYGKKSSDNKTYTWYNTSDANAQFNQLGTTYYFLGIAGVKTPS